MHSIWRIPESSAPPHIADWAARLGVDPYLAGLLWQRGLHTFEAMDEFLMPRLQGLAAPETWPGLEKAAETILSVMDQGKALLVWGDYDVDGVTGAVLVRQVLNFHGIDCQVHLPDRLIEGYGLGLEAVEDYASKGVGAILTVDCGISDVTSVARAKELGLTVVVSDHHLPPDVLPPADAIYNPRLGESPCPHLAGVGVAFFLMATVNARLAERGGRRMDMREVLDLVTLGTLADVVPITGQNRILVKNGLLLVAQASRPGLAELKAVSGYSPTAALGAGQVVFNVTPRINAAGRMARAMDAFNLLCASDHDSAAELAKTLDRYNLLRRAEEENILAEALEQARSQVEDHARSGLIIWGGDWHQGVIGIVAARLVEAFYRPVFVLCRDKGSYKGSGRSIPEFDLHAALEECADLLLSYGGHRQAAGLRIREEHLEALRDRFDAIAARSLGAAPLVPSLRLDGELGFALAADPAFLKNLEQLQPFGIGNPEPVFSSPPLLVRKQRVFGPNRDHLALEVTDSVSGITLQAKLWRKAAEFPNLPPNAHLKLAYSPTLNAYNGVTSVELRVRDWKLD